MYYLKEEERGFYPEEDLAVPGRYEVSLKAKESKEITFVASLEDNTEQVDANKVFEEEIIQEKQTERPSAIALRTASRFSSLVSFNIPLGVIYTVQAVVLVAKILLFLS